MNDNLILGFTERQFGLLVNTLFETFKCPDQVFENNIHCNKNGCKEYTDCTECWTKELKKIKVVK